MTELYSNTNVVRKFYFLDYFYILLRSVKLHSNQNDIFESFKVLKKQHLLGDSKYKKLSSDENVERLTKKQLAKFRYTFEQVIAESLDYKLIEKRHVEMLRPVPSRWTAETRKIDDQRKQIYLTNIGEDALLEYERSKQHFNLFVLKLMEKNHNSFKQLINLCYSDRTLKNGLLILPIYSGLKLGFEKSNFVTNGHVIEYSKALAYQLEKDIRTYTNKNVSLKEKESELILKLKNDKILGEDNSKAFNTEFYNAILSRFRKYWLNYFLKDIYNYPNSFSVFNIWIERARQVGVLHTTEFFPDFSGRIIYPTSVVVREMNNPDFLLAFKYPTNETLYIHSPVWENYHEQFVKVLLDEYYILQKTRKTHFINLSDLKERICFKLRIPSFVFDDFLQNTYSLNLQGKLHIQISLEADRLPQETNALYLKREPILVHGKYKNIIAINYR